MIHKFTMSCTAEVLEMNPIEWKDVQKICRPCKESSEIFDVKCKKVGTVLLPLLNVSTEKRP